jgi:hypothetical protein
MNLIVLKGQNMNLENEYAAALLDKDREKAKIAALHILNNEDINAWNCLVESSEHIFDFIKQKIANTFSDVVDESNYLKLFSLFKIHSSDWDDILIQILIRFSYSDKNLTSKMLELLENGNEDEKAYAAKYFTYIHENKAGYRLLKNYQSDYEPLKYNSASALGHIGDVYSYEYYIAKLESDDDWERIDAAQFLTWYGNKKAFLSILKAMSTSTMSEYIAGEAAMLEDIHKYFDSDDLLLKNLVLECYENILSGLAEIWPMSVLVDFKVYEIAKTLINLAKTSHASNYISRYAVLLLKTKLIINLFMENDTYRYDEHKNVINELEEICGLFVSEDENFWNKQKELVLSEIIGDNEKRKLFAMSIAGDYNIISVKDTLIELISNNRISEVLLLQSLQTLKSLNSIGTIENKDVLLLNFADPNLKAAAESLFIN